MSKSRLDRHIEDEEKRLDGLEVAIHEIRDNHLAHVQAKLESISADLRWVKWIVLSVGGAVITSLVAKIIGLINT